MQPKAKPLTLCASSTATPSLFGGRSAILRNVPARTVQDMKFPGAPYGLKMACGENPKRVYGSRGRAPSSRSGALSPV